MHKNIYIYLPFLIAFTICCQKPHIYYIDPENGSDLNSGLTEAKPWASLEQINKTVLRPGDHVLFKSGSTLNGQFIPLGSGSKSKPVVITNYGQGSLPEINAQGKYESALYLLNIQYITVKNLILTNSGISREPGRKGIYIHAKDFGDCNQICLSNLTIKNVNGSLIKSKGGGSGILWKNEGDSIKTRFVDLIIENCHLIKCERNGITSSGYYSRKNWYPSIGVIIRNNLLEQIPGDGIVPIGCDGALIEHNVMRDCPDILPYSEAAAGIWPWSSDNTVIQYNEVSGHNSKWDGQGFDSDWNCQNTIIQYNYSHDNAGGFLLICNNGFTLHSDINIGTTGTIVRYNISINDGIRQYPTKRAGYFSPSIHITGPCYNSSIYNNVIFIPAKINDSIDHTLLHTGDWGDKWPEKTYWANNIFYTLGDSLEFDFGNSIENVFESNLYYGPFINLPNDKSAIYKNPGWLSDINKPIKQINSECFKINSGSACKDAGTKVSNQVLTDYFGNQVSINKPDIGIHEYQNE